MTIMKNNTVTRKQYDSVVEGKMLAIATLHAEVKALKREVQGRTRWIAVVGATSVVQTLGIVYVILT